MNRAIIASIWGLMAVVAFAARIRAATPFVLTFDGVQDEESIGNYYDGGLSGNGSGPGPDFNVTFPIHALAFIGHTPPPKPTLLYWTDSRLPSIVINASEGFDTGFSLLFTSDVPGSITVYDGLNASGNILATKILPDTQFGPLAPAGVAFNGIARSVALGRWADLIAFDNLTFGRSHPIVPEPGSLCLACAAAAIVLGMTRVRRLPI